ncbi:MAG: thiopurine S-methyltransferase [Gammaproteobacteria bacterium]|nr:thiopurine S-methyltransferase [Gammaproteobacteria bacterium]
MESSFWKARWEANQIGFHEAAVHPMLLAHGARLGNAGTVFVPLCGKSHDMAWLVAQGLAVTGIELSDIAVRAFFAEHGLPAQHTRLDGHDEYRAPGYRLLCGDFFALSRDTLGAFNAIYDRAALIALPPAMRRDYAATMSVLAAPATRMLLVTVEYDTSVLSPPPFAVSAEEVSSLYGDSWDIEDLGTRAADVKGQAGTEQAFWLTRR